MTQLFEKLDFFRLMDRNRHSVELMTEALKRHDHIRMHERVEKAAHAAASSTQDEIRMIAALGAVTGFDDWAPTLLARVPSRDAARRAERDDPRHPAAARRDARRRRLRDSTATMPSIPDSHRDLLDAQVAHPRDDWP